MPTVTRNNRVLLLDTNHPLLQEALEDEGFVCDYFPGLDRAGLLDIVGNYSGLIVRSRFHLDREVLEKAARLSFIGRVGAGMEGIDTEYALGAGIRCFNAPEGNRNAVAEHAVGMLLAMMNKMLTCDREVRSGIWKREENRGIELEKKTVAIIGYGNTGSTFARKLKGFGCRVIAYDKYKSGFSSEFVEEVMMDEIYATADVLSLHVPLTRETEYLVNNTYLTQFRKPLWLINTSRGRVVSTADLLDALDSGKVLGAALDVIEYESLSFETLEDGTLPEPFRRLASSDKVILTPHVAGWTHESKIKLAEVITDKILAEFKAPTAR